MEPLIRRLSRFVALALRPGTPEEGANARERTMECARTLGATHGCGYTVQIALHAAFYAAVYPYPVVDADHRRAADLALDANRPALLLWHAAHNAMVDAEARS